jgi:ubiquinone/menaquinone biosynthesis C-methylase UbiE
MATPPTPERVLQTLNAFQQTAALKAAIELDIFSAIADGHRTAPALAARCEASLRGIRIVCDYLTVTGFLTKADGAYGLAPDTAAFLTQQSPTYLGSAAEFLASPPVIATFDDLADTIRRGTIRQEMSTVTDANPVWVRFARGMAPMMMPAAHAICDIIGASSGAPMRVLDLAAGHGMFGITIARENRRAEIVAVDWPSVLAVASENAQRYGVADRFQRREGDAMRIAFGSGYDLALITNFLHHFDPPTCTAFLRKTADALVPGGRVVILDFVPNDDRVSPAVPAAFSLTMLAGTPFGDAYTLPEHTRFLTDAGFTDVTAHTVQRAQTILVATRS